ncbi:VapC toxin family PIN domain ribonuclease [bacterium B13(2017)]|nr:VapC toxin family PIN domain ribonuclease [bacterium B13(2017)]
MILVDTSVWITHFREGISHLEELLMDASVAIHPFIIGELACGNLKNRKEILSLLSELPKTQSVENHDVLSFIEKNKLMGRGIGLIDNHLLSSSLLSNTPLWTFDKKLEHISKQLEINYSNFC